MKKTQKSLSAAAILAFALCFAGCNKKADVAPAADKELQSSVDISYANLIVSDIDMICSYIGENNLSPKFYLAAPGFTDPVVNRDPNQNMVYVTFYSNTLCVDGKVRNGTIVMNYAYLNPNAKYYRDYQFEGKVSLTNYQVDGWKVGLNNTFFITNKLSSPAYDPKTTNLSWELKGDFSLNHPTDPSKSMRCNVDLTKTLANTSDINVFPPSKQAAINWSLSVVEYKGTVFGETAGMIPFTFSVNDKNPLVRDFSCYPDKVAGVSTTPSLTVSFNEFHPFTKGVASFTTGALYPREIAYGNEQSTFNSKVLPQQCDNKGIVTIKGISYAVDF